MAKFIELEVSKDKECAKSSVTIKPFCVIGDYKSVIDTRDRYDKARKIQQTRIALFI